MKKLILLTAAMLCSVSLAQNPSPSLQPSMVTPSPPAGLAGGLGVNAAQTTVYHFAVPRSVIQAQNATSADLLLFTTDAGKSTVINWVAIGVPAQIKGGGITAATAQVRTSGNTYGSAQDAFTAVVTPAIMYDIAAGSAVEAGGTAVNVRLTSTTSNLSAATSGHVDIWVSRTVLQ
jgi:hypothetical protein